MNVTTYARGMAAYNQWMNEKVYACAAELTDEERKRDMGAFFGSIHRTLNHLYLGDLAWMERFHGEPITMKSPADVLFDDFDQLRTARRALDERIARWAESLTDEFVDGPYRFKSVTYQRTIEMPGWAAMVQVFNHQTHHRGQVTTLLKQLGKDPGPTDIPVMPGITSRS
jgi:uncharacterized damage-inducible protein DinB